MLGRKLNAGELSIGSFSDELETRGHAVLEKWWTMDKLSTPYLDHLGDSRLAADAMESAAYDSDVMIMFPTDTVLGAAVELGAAIASKRENPEKQVIVVDPFEVRQSIFYAHSAVVAVRGIAQIRAMEWY